MIKLKRFITIFLSGLLCVTMVGCSNNSKENKDAGVRAEFQKAMEKCRGMTFGNCLNSFDVSDPSILSEETKEKYGENFKSISRRGTLFYDNKKDESNKVTDTRILKMIDTATMYYIDGSDKVEKVYIPGDGFKYTNKDGIKTKSRYFSSFISVADISLNIDYVENLTMTKEGDKKIFKYNYKIKPDIMWYSEWDSCLRKDSDIERKGISGTLIIDEKNNTIKEILSEKYADKKTDATAIGNFVINLSNIDQELAFPKDLETYKLVE